MPMAQMEVPTIAFGFGSSGRLEKRRKKGPRRSQNLQIEGKTSGPWERVPRMKALESKKSFGKLPLEEASPLIRELQTLNKLLCILIELLAYDNPTEAYKLASEARNLVKQRRRGRNALH